MDQTNTGQQQMPGMKAMMYMMPLMFLVFFNQNASGLSYYYFISTLITIVQTLIFRYTINEDKLLAKLEANKKKPAKKIGLHEASRGGSKSTTGAIEETTERKKVK
jgi:YidC/Oxa1 family membrane protein insertase